MNSAKDVWSAVLELLKQSLTPVAINTWFNDCSIVSITDTRVVLCVPSEFKKGVIESRFKGEIEKALRDIFAGDLEVSLITEEEEAQLTESKTETGGENEVFTFENFIVGASNQFAYAAAKAVAEEQTKDYNPLFIYGDSGLGKTHLLYAIRNELKRRHPDYYIVLVRGGDFMDELITAIQTGRNIEFREKYRLADVLLIDDIQVISGKTSTEQEVFYTFNTLYEAQKQIVFTSDRPPSEMLLLADRLRTRFESGLLADIQVPDYETRVAIIRNKSMQLGLILPEDVMAYIANNMTANVRQLEGAVKKLRAHRDLMGSEITVQTAAKIIEDMFREKASYVPTPDDIIDETAKYYSITPEEIRGKSQTRDITKARQISMYLVRQLTNFTLDDIGQLFNGRDHSTVLSSIKKIEGTITKNSELSLTIKDITANINSRGQ